MTNEAKLDVNGIIQKAFHGLKTGTLIDNLKEQAVEFVEGAVEEGEEFSTIEVEAIANFLVYLNES